MILPWSAALIGRETGHLARQDVGRPPVQGTDGLQGLMFFGDHRVGRRVGGGAIGSKHWQISFRVEMVVAGVRRRRRFAGVVLHFPP